MHFTLYTLRINFGKHCYYNFVSSTLMVFSQWCCCGVWFWWSLQVGFWTRGVDASGSGTMAIVFPWFFQTLNGNPSLRKDGQPNKKNDAFTLGVL